MLRRLLLCGFSMAALITVQCNSAQCQENQKTSVVDQMYDLPGTMFFMRSVNSSQEHVDSATTDFLGSKFPFDIGQYFPDEMNRDKPIIFYKFDGTYTEASQLPFDSRKDIVRMSKDKIGDASDLTTPFQITKPVIGDFPLFGGKHQSHGVVRGDYLIAVPDDKLPSGEFDFSMHREVMAAKPLRGSIDTRMTEFIERTGMGIFARRDIDDGEIDVRWDATWFGGRTEWSERERQLLEKLDAAIEQTVSVAAGVIYEKQQLNVEGHVKFAETDVFDGLIDFDAAAESRFVPTVGLPANNLLGSLSIQTSAFDSEEVARFVFKALSPAVGFATGASPDTGFFRLTGGLIADAWRDVKGVRIAIYHGDVDRYSIVVIFDAREPEAFFGEIEKLVAIVEPLGEEKNEVADQEILNLIEDLGSRKWATRERAETRLAISGERAEAALKTVVAKSENAEQRIRANRLLEKLKGPALSKERNAQNINFWANFEPRFSIERGAGTYMEMEQRKIRFFMPDDLGERTKKHAKEILQQTFGRKWNEIPIVRVGDQFAMMFGSNEELFKQTVSNLRDQKDPVRKIAAGDAPAFRDGQLQMHLSFRHLRETFVEERAGNFIGGVDYPDAEELTSVSLSFFPDYLQGILNFPVEEVAPCLDCQSLLNRDRAGF